MTHENRRSETQHDSRIFSFFKPWVNVVYPPCRYSKLVRTLRTPIVCTRIIAYIYQVSNVES
jgi:hypothetical protein